MHSSEKVERHCLRFLRAQWRFNEDFSELAVEMLGGYSPEALEGGTKAAIAKSGRYKPTLSDIDQGIRLFITPNEGTPTTFKRQREHADHLKGDEAMKTLFGQQALQEGWGSAVWHDAARGNQFKAASKYRMEMAEAKHHAAMLEDQSQPMHLRKELTALWRNMQAHEVDLRNRFLEV